MRLIKRKCGWCKYDFTILICKRNEKHTHYVHVPLAATNQAMVTLLQVLIYSIDKS